MCGGVFSLASWPRDCTRYKRTQIDRYGVQLIKKYEWKVWTTRTMDLMAISTATCACICQDNVFFCVAYEALFACYAWHVMCPAICVRVFTLCVLFGIGGLLAECACECVCVCVEIVCVRFTSTIALVFFYSINVLIAMVHGTIKQLWFRFFLFFLTPAIFSPRTLT